MLSISKTKGRKKLSERQNTNESIKASTLIDKAEKVPDLIKESLKYDENARAGKFSNENKQVQQLRVKIFPISGSTTVIKDRSKPKFSNSVVVAGMWIPEEGEVHVYHYEGENFQTEDKMYFEYMWYDENGPKSPEQLEEISKIVIGNRNINFGGEYPTLYVKNERDLEYLKFVKICNSLNKTYLHNLRKNIIKEDDQK